MSTPVNYKLVCFISHIQKHFCFVIQQSFYILCLIVEIVLGSLTTHPIMILDPVHGEVYLIQHYVIKFVSNLRQACGFLRVLRFPPPIKLTTII